MSHYEIWSQPQGILGIGIGHSKNNFIYFFDIYSLPLTAQDHAI